MHKQIENDFKFHVEKKIATQVDKEQSVFSLVV
jgi:hypothetical protein